MRRSKRKMIAIILVATVLLSLLLAAAPVFAAREKTANAGSFGAAKNVRLRQTANMSAVLNALSAVAGVPNDCTPRCNSPGGIRASSGLYRRT